jgi:cell shape-determining protein MreC
VINDSFFSSSFTSILESVDDGTQNFTLIFIILFFLLMFTISFNTFPCSHKKWNFHLSSRRAMLARVGSQIFQAWRKFMDEIEQQSKQIRFNAEQLENLCSDRMSQLYQDKRKSRKQYQEEHSKIAMQFAHVS